MVGVEKRARMMRPALAGQCVDDSGLDIAGIMAGLNANRDVEIDRDEIRVDNKSLPARLSDRVNEVR